MRFCTNPDRPGTEKLVVSDIHPEILTSPRVMLRCADICVDGKKHVNLLPPMSLFLVKGWSRCVAAVACLLHAYEEPEAFEVSVFSDWNCLPTDVVVTHKGPTHY